LCNIRPSAYDEYRKEIIDTDLKTLAPHCVANWIGLTTANPRETYSEKFRGTTTCFLWWTFSKQITYYRTWRIRAGFGWI
jgi:hypothetical protein